MDKRDIINRLIVTLVTAVVVAALAAHTCNPFIAMGSGFAASMAAAFGYLKVTSKGELLRDALSALIGCQTGWVALLI